MLRSILVLAIGLLITQSEARPDEIRSLKLYHIHTREKVEVVFMRNGQYDPKGLKRASLLLKDWRRNQLAQINPKLLDLLWSVYQATDATGYIFVVGGFRSPETNAMLRDRSSKSGVAERSQHMLGNAIDFFIPGVPLSTLREAAVRLQGGGVGYYPRSGSPFIHLDVGPPRMWPRMTQQELVALFPNGRTVYLPSGTRIPSRHQALVKSDKFGEPPRGKGSEYAGLLPSAPGTGNNASLVRSEKKSASRGAEDSVTIAKAAPVLLTLVDRSDEKKSRQSTALFTSDVPVPAARPEQPIPNPYEVPIPLSKPLPITIADNHPPALRSLSLQSVRIRRSASEKTERLMYRQGVDSIPVLRQPDSVRDHRWVFEQGYGFEFAMTTSSWSGRMRQKPDVVYVDGFRVGWEPRCKDRFLGSAVEFRNLKRFRPAH